MEFTQSGQMIILAKILKDEKTFTLLSGILDPEDFTIPELGKIFNVIKQYYIRFKKLPDVSELNEMLDPSSVVYLGQLKNIDATVDCPALVNFLIERKRKTKFKNALLRALEVVDTNYDLAYTTIKNVIVDTTTYNISATPAQHELASLLFSSRDEVAYTTGLKAIDKLFPDGLIRRGEVLFLASPSGGGKSTFLCKMASHLLRYTPVLYITLELSKRDIVEKVARCCLTQDKIDSFGNVVSYHDIPPEKRDEFDYELIRLFTSRKHPLYVEYYPSYSITPNQIASYLEGLRVQSGQDIWVLIVDYLDLLKPSSHNDLKNQQEWVKVAAIWQEIVDIARMYNISCLTASQVDKRLGDTTLGEDIQQKHVAGSREKVNKSDIAIAFKPTGDRMGRFQDGQLTFLKVRRSTLPVPQRVRVDYFNGDMLPLENHPGKPKTIRKANIDQGVLEDGK